MKPTPAQLLVLVAIEGFASLAYEVLALRRIVPYVGSAITVTAPTIAIFLAALALGYHAAGRIEQHAVARVVANFIVAALIGGVLMSERATAAVFGFGGGSEAALVGWLLIAMAPPAYLLAQTVPALAGLLERARTGEASAVALAASTAGSVLGALGLSLWVMQRWGVRVALLLTSGLLLAAAAVAAWRIARPRLALLAGLVAVPIVAINALAPPNVAETAYADYDVEHSSDGGRTLIVNGQRASGIDAAKPPERFAYVEHMAKVIERESRAAKPRRVLVLGAGGFTLSLGDAVNDYTYVDIDPKIRAIAEQHFLKQEIRGRFVADDARRFVVHDAGRYEVIVVDAYTSHVSIPTHLVTVEFWRSLKPRLASGGLVLVNLVLEPSLQSPYARNMLATIQAALGQCAISVLNPSGSGSNVIVECRPGAGEGAGAIYTDDRNPAALERNRMGY